MRVLMLNYEFPPLGGGAANATYYILKQMQKYDNLHVDLITSSPDEAVTEYWGPRIVFHKLDVKKKCIHYWTELEILRWSWQARRKAKELMVANQYDVCHAFFGIPCGFVARLSCNSLPYIVSLRGSDVPGFNDRFAFQYIVLKPIIRRIWRDAAAVVALSKEGKGDALKTSPHQDMEVIPNGIDIGEFHPDEGNKNRGLSPVTIICTSRLVARKGLDYLLWALLPLKQKYNNGFEVQIIGEGNARESLQDLARKLKVDDVVEFKGYIKHSELPEYYRGADIFVLPSLTEAFCNSRIEAMACGLPIVTTDTGGVHAVMQNRSGVLADNGFIVAPKDVPALTVALDNLIGSRELRQKMGQASLTHINEFTWESVAQSYVSLYERVSKGASH